MLDVANVVKVTSSGLIGASALAGALAATGASSKTGGFIGFSLGIISALFICKYPYFDKYFEKYFSDLFLCTF